MTGMPGYPQTMIPYAAPVLMGGAATGRMWMNNARQAYDYGSGMIRDGRALVDDFTGNFTNYPTRYVKGKKRPFASNTQYSRGRGGYPGGQGRLTANPIRGRTTQKGGAKKKVKYCNAKRLCEEVSAVKTNIKHIQRVLKENEGIMRFRQNRYGTIKSLTNSKILRWVSASAIDNMKLMLASLMFKDDAGIYTTRGEDVTLQNQYNIDSLTHKLTVRNNNGVDVRLTIYSCEPREDTELSPEVIWKNNEAVTYNGTGTTVDIGTYPSDSTFVNNIWNMKRVFHGVITPGQSTSVSHTSKDGRFEVPVTGVVGTNYQPSWKPQGFLMMVEGTLGHDPLVPTNSGVLNVGVDYHTNSTARISYDAGGDTNFVIIDNVFPPLSAPPVQGQKPRGGNETSDLTATTFPP